MLNTTRRRMLALLLAAGVTSRLFTLRASAAEEGETDAEEPQPEAGEPEATEPQEEGETECYDSQKFGDWLGQATNNRAGARINDVPFEHAEKSALRADLRVSASYDARLVLYAVPDDLVFTKEYLIDPQNRLIVRDEHGKEAVNEALCGNCTDIEEDKFEMVMPLASAPLLRESPAIGIAMKLAGHDESSFKLKLEDMRKALEWADKRKGELAEEFSEGKCVAPPEDA